MIRDLLEAFRFLTVFPFPQRFGKTGTLSRSMLFFPLVGFVIGALSLGIYFLARSFFSERISALILIGTPILLSGGLHVDGFADFCDGFFGGKDRADVLRIMKDPNIGVWGALGLVFLVLAKFELIQLAFPKEKVFLMAMAASRWTQVALSFFLPYAGSGGGLSEGVAGRVKVSCFLGATLFVLFPVLWLGAKGVLIFSALIVFLILLSILFRKKIGGLTGDVIGASSEMTELFIFAAAAVRV